MKEQERQRMPSTRLEAVSKVAYRMSQRYGAEITEGEVFQFVCELLHDRPKEIWFVWSDMIITHEEAVNLLLARLETKFESCSRVEPTAPLLDLDKQYRLMWNAFFG